MQATRFAFLLVVCGASAFPATIIYGPNVLPGVVKRVEMLLEQVTVTIYIVCAHNTLILLADWIRTIIL